MSAPVLDDGPADEPLADDHHIADRRSIIAVHYGMDTDHE